MCRNIKVLFNFDPPVTQVEIHEASLQYVRKISGFHEPSKINEEAFDEAVNDIASVSMHLLHHLKTDAPKKDRPPKASLAKGGEEEARKAHARAIARFGEH